MRNALFRILAGLIVIAAVWAVGFSFSRGELTWGSLVGTWSAIAGFILIVPTFGTYALRGEKAGNRVLIRMSQVMHLPEHWFNRFVIKHVEVPPEFNKLDENKEPRKIGNMGPG